MFFSIWAKLISLSLFLLELVSFEFLSFSVSSVSTAHDTTRSVHFPIIIIRRSLLLADRNCYGPLFGFQSSLSGSGYFCLLWAHLRPFQQRAGALQSPCFHITGSQSCWLKKDPFSNNCVEGEEDAYPLSLFAKNPGKYLIAPTRITLSGASKSKTLAIFLSNAFLIWSGMHQNDIMRCGSDPLLGGGILAVCVASWHRSMVSWYRSNM